MILITGGTGFIGRVLIQKLSALDYPVRILVRPSTQSPNIPHGVPVEVAVSSLKDERGMRAAMKGVDTVYHLAGVEGQGTKGDLLDVDIQGTQAVVQAAEDAGVKRIYFLSHLGADRASAFPVLKAKAIGESFIRRSKVEYTIFRSSVVYGVNDHFTTALGFLLNIFPGIFLMPGDGLTLLQPIWVEDLVTAMVWALEEPTAKNQIYQVGGPEYISLKEILENIMAVVGVNRLLVPTPPVLVRALTAYFAESFSDFPTSVYLMDYLAADRTCGLDVLPRQFGLIPARFSQSLDFLRNQTWQQNTWKFLLTRRIRKRSA